MTQRAFPNQGLQGDFELDIKDTSDGGRGPRDTPPNLKADDSDDSDDSGNCGDSGVSGVFTTQRAFPDQGPQPDFELGIEKINGGRGPREIPPNIK